MANAWKTFISAPFSWLLTAYRKTTLIGVDSATPEPLIERVVFSNNIYIYGALINFAFTWLNFQKENYFSFWMNWAYTFAIALGLFLNAKKEYFWARFSTVVIIFTTLALSGLVQGRKLELEHYFIPFGILAFSMFRAEERKFSYLFLLLALGIYWILLLIPEPVFSFGQQNFAPTYVNFNRAGYLALTFACLYALSNAFDRALKLIGEQRNRLFEERRLASIGEISCNIAHEINTPLTALDLQLYQLETRLLKGDLSKEEALERLGKMRSVSRRISVIVRGMKFLAGKDENDPFSKKEIGSILELALDLTRDKMEKNGVCIQLEGNALRTEIRCKPVALSQVFLNLFSNAVDAVTKLPESSRWIKVTTATEGGFLVVGIEDGGKIEDPEIISNLFKSFFTTKPPGQGTGLGLSISKETIENHKGTLNFHPGSPNTKFVIRLPLS